MSKGIRHHREPAASMAATRRSIVMYCKTSGPPMSKLLPGGLGQLEHTDQVAHDVVDRDHCVLVRTQRA